MSKKYKTVYYLRLSRDDETDKESCSISNQREMLTAFVNDREDLEFVGEYVDDGQRGYEFYKSLVFQSMISAVKDGKIECIVVKDLSRLGRNFQKTEEYIQRVFPKLGVRFIAVNSCFDSEREQSSSERLSYPVMNLLNEFHVMETSQKVRSVLEHHRRNGKFIGNHAVYGYAINNKSLEPDPEAADTVRKIFDLRISGLSCLAISEYLNEDGIKCPLEYKIEKGIPITKNFRENETASWSSASVRRILENPVYTGTLVQGKTTSQSYRDKRRIIKEPSEWAVFENSHDAVITETVFQIVESLLQKDSYTKCGYGCYLFSGFAFCGNCGKVLYHRQGGKSVYWQCMNKECKEKGTIKEKLLSETVFHGLKTHMEMILNYSEPITKPDFLSKIVLEDLEIKELAKQIEQLNNSKNNLLQQKENGIISESDFFEMNKFYDNKIVRAEYESEGIKKRKMRLANCIDDITERYLKYSEMTVLTRDIVVTFVDRIEVFSKTKIRVSFRYEDFFVRNCSVPLNRVVI